VAAWANAPVKSRAKTKGTEDIRVDLIITKYSCCDILV
jgi:hypothetical protein